MAPYFRSEDYLFGVMLVLFLVTKQRVETVKLEENGLDLQKLIASGRAEPRAPTPSSRAESAYGTG